MSLNPDAARADGPLAFAAPALDVAESDLIRQAIDGDSSAFEQLVRRHTTRVFNFLFQMTRQRQDAEDLAQQTFIKAYRNLHRVDATRPIINWLLTIARRSALNHFRAAKRWEEMPEDLASAGPTPAREAEKSEERHNLWDAARERLPQKEFEVLWLRFGEDLSTAETARVVGLTQTHVKVLVFRAKKHLANFSTP